MHTRQLPALIHTHTHQRQTFLAGSLSKHARLFQNPGILGAHSTAWRKHSHARSCALSCPRQRGKEGSGGEEEEEDFNNQQVETDVVQHALGLSEVIDTNGLVSIQIQIHIHIQIHIQIHILILIPTLSCTPAPKS